MAIRRAMLVLLLLFLPFLLGSCGEGKKTANKDVFVLFTGTADSWYRSGYALQDGLERDGFLVDLCFESNHSQQEEDFRQALEKKPLVIIVGAIDGESLYEELAEAKAKNIPIIAYDRMITNTRDIFCFTGYDSKEIGRAQGRAIEAALSLKEETGPASIEIFAGDARDNNAVLFYEGAMEILQPYLDKGYLVVPSGEKSFEQVMTSNWSSSLAKKRMERILTDFYADRSQLDAVLSPNDELALGIRSALDEQYREKFPFITGLDGDSGALRAIASGKQGMTLVKDPEPLVRECIKVVNAIAEGKEVKADVNIPNGAGDIPAFLCTPLLIDKANLNKGKYMH